MDGHDPALPLVIDPASDLIWSTFLGGFLGGSGGDEGGSLEVGTSGCVYVAGYTTSSDFPATPGAFDTSYNSWDCFVTKINESGTDLLYSTFLGGTNWDSGKCIALDNDGYVYVTGATDSSDFPVILNISTR